MKDSLIKRNSLLYFDFNQKCIFVSCVVLFRAGGCLSMVRGVGKAAWWCCDCVSVLDCKAVTDVLCAWPSRLLQVARPGRHPTKAVSLSPPTSVECVLDLFGDPEFHKCALPPVPSYIPLSYLQIHCFSVPLSGLLSASLVNARPIPFLGEPTGTLAVSPHSIPPYSPYQFFFNGIGRNLKFYRGFHPFVKY